MITTHRSHTYGFSGGYLDIQFIKKFIKILESSGVDRHFSVGRFEEDIDVEHEDAELLEHTDDSEKDWQEDFEQDGLDL